MTNPSNIEVDEAMNNQTEDYHRLNNALRSIWTGINLISAEKSAETAKNHPDYFGALANAMRAINSGVIIGHRHVRHSIPSGFYTSIYEDLTALGYTVNIPGGGSLNYAQPKSNLVVDISW